MRFPLVDFLRAGFTSRHQVGGRSAGLSGPGLTADVEVDVATQPLLIADGNVRIEQRDPEESIATAVEVPAWLAPVRPAPQPPVSLPRASSLAELARESLLSSPRSMRRRTCRYEHPRVHGQSHLHAFRDGTEVLHIIAAESRRRFRLRRRRPEAPCVSNHNPPLSLDGAG